MKTKFSLVTPNVSHMGLGWKFIHRGLGLFITGFISGFIPIAHYIHGALAGDVGPAFLKNMTLWWGCPGILAELTLKTGGLGMLAIGFCYLAIARQGGGPGITANERLAVTLCAYGLVAELVTAAAGYAICNYFWPNFFFQPVQAGKNTWLVAQGISIAVYVVGLFYAFSGIRRGSAHLLMIDSPGSLPTQDSPMAYQHSYTAAQPSEPSFLMKLWQQKHWRVIAWLSAVAVAGFWVYHGMPMVCH